MLFSASEQTRTELEWTLERAGADAPLDWLVSADDIRDTLTLRVRDGELPCVLFLDLRHAPLEGAKLLRWAAGIDALERVLLVVFANNPTNEHHLQLIGADVVLPGPPDAAKTRQLVGIARQLARLDRGSGAALRPSRRGPQPAPPQPSP